MVKEVSKTYKISVRKSGQDRKEYEFESSWAGNAINGLSDSNIVGFFI